jgi:hypothetical protein
MTPRRQAIAFRIWSHAESVGWDITVRELADAIGEKSFTVRNIVVEKGWHGRLRAKSHKMVPMNFYDIRSIAMHFEFDEMEG